MANTGLTIHITHDFGFGVQTALIVAKTEYFQSTVNLSWTL